jgi:hypothetical protein
MNLWEKDGAFLKTALADEQADMGDRASLPCRDGNIIREKLE